MTICLHGIVPYSNYSLDTVSTHESNPMKALTSRASILSQHVRSSKARNASYSAFPVRKNPSLLKGVMRRSSPEEPE